MQKLVRFTASFFFFALVFLFSLLSKKTKHSKARSCVWFKFKVFLLTLLQALDSQLFIFDFLQFQ